MDSVTQIDKNVSSSAWSAVGESSERGEFWACTFLSHLCTLWAWLDMTQVMRLRSTRVSQHRRFRLQLAFLWIDSLNAYDPTENIELPAQLLDYFLRSNQNNINQSCLRSIFNFLSSPKSWKEGRTDTPTRCIDNVRRDNRVWIPCCDSIGST